MVAIGLLQLLQIVVAMSALLGISSIGFWMMFQSVKEYYGKIAFVRADNPCAADVSKEVAVILRGAIMGLEFLLLAPLAFLILRSLSEYVEDLLIRGAKRSQVGSGPQKASHLLPGKESILDTKALTVGLMFGIVATHIVGDLITHQHGEAFLLPEAIIGLSLLAMLAILYISIELIGHKMKLPSGSGHGVTPVPPTVPKPTTTAIPAASPSEESPPEGAMRRS